MSTFKVGTKYEMLIPVAKQLADKMGLKFTDNVNYQFTCHGIASGMLWSRDISYHPPQGVPAPPPPHPVYGSPFGDYCNAYIREASDS
jgi:hypothetical protein